MTVVARIRFCDEPLLSTLVVFVSTKEIQLKNKTLSKCWAQQGGGVGWGGDLFLEPNSLKGDYPSHKIYRILDNHIER